MSEPVIINVEDSEGNIVGRLDPVTRRVIPGEIQAGEFVASAES
jgi:hypothetical protein